LAAQWGRNLSEIERRKAVQKTKKKPHWDIRRKSGAEVRKGLVKAGKATIQHKSKENFAQYDEETIRKLVRKSEEVSPKEGQTKGLVGGLTRDKNDPTS